TILPMDEHRLVRHPGTRRHYCPNSPVYRSYTGRIVQAMVERYRATPSVIGWQIDNEFGLHNTGRCYCDTCAERFRSWLQDRYQTLNNLNAAWGTSFWGQVYTAWKEVPIPWAAPGRHNPSFLLDFFRFASDSFVDYQQMQVDIIRKIAPHQFTTHNMVPLPFDQINYHDLARALDIVSWDSYEFPDVTTPALTGFSHDMMRGLRSKNYWVMEQQCRQDSVRPYNPVLPPGEVRLRTYQAIAHGADGMLYFPWRSARSGAEQYEGGLLTHARETTRAYDEVKRIGRELKSFGPLLADTQPVADVAMLLSYENIWALQLPSHNAQLTGMEGLRSYFVDYYEELHGLNVSVAILHPEADFSGYRMVIAPSLILMNERIVSNIYEYVARGGNLLLTIRSGVKDWHNLVTDQPLPGSLRAVAGIRISEFDSLPPTRTYDVAFVNEEMPRATFPVRLWCEVIEPETAEVIGEYVSGPHQGKAALTVNEYGEGQVAYMGVLGTRDVCRVVLEWLVARAGVRPFLKAPAGVEVARRVAGNAEFLFLLNYANVPHQISLDGPYADAITGTAVSAVCDLPSREVRILQRHCG
ncbi:MAG TPA: beta-galactosidase, partial [Nitrospiraceae bacterium]|nr:beta-galactosidase [Nitrospiraceae bacterium]